MRNVDLLFCFLCLNFLLSGYCIENIHSQPIKNDFFVDITPNQFKGSDIERIQQAIRLAQKTSRKVVIPQSNANGTLAWKIDRAILLPSDITIILDNCTIQLSDECRDNMFRSENVGTGIEHPVWLNNIHLIGVGKVLLKGADNPRATGDAYRTLVMGTGKGRISYGSDAGKKGEKQRGDWRNNLIQIALVDEFSIKNVTIQNSHAWAMSFERTKNAEISAIRFNNPEIIEINGKKVSVYNKDGIDLRHGCKYFKIDDISGLTGDDFIALSSLDIEPYYHSNGDINSYQVTSTRWNGPEDDTEQIFITNCRTNYPGVAIRASDNASIHHVYIDGIVVTNRPDSQAPYMESPYTLYIGGRGYGKLSIAGKINNIYASNLTGDGKSLITIEAPITDCLFMNGIYTGTAPSAITYKIDKSETKNIIEVNLIKTSKD
ncbi:glycosyl hydrolase family 28 protein [Petrimonas sp.]|uniref:glycosyl hydrolase family 28 protein n=1 Tax=Petrimonas sp. TaxID=2023866 RepID=UPI002FC6E7A9